MNLLKVLRRLHASEINCGLQTFFDAGLEVWVGDEMNGRRSVETFHDRDRPMSKAAEWLHEEALRLYPLSRYARKHAARTADVGFAPPNRLS